MHLQSRIWPVTTLILAFVLLASMFTAQAQPETPPKPADPPRREGPQNGGAVQPSSSVEATVLAIAYDAVKRGDAKVTPQAVGQFAAEMMNAFSKSRK